MSAACAGSQSADQLATLQYLPFLSVSQFVCVSICRRLSLCAGSQSADQLASCSIFPLSVSQFVCVSICPLSASQFVCVSISPLSASQFVCVTIRPLCAGSQSADQLATLLTKMCLSSEASGGRLTVEVPPTRHDILHACDVVEDVAIAYGYNNIQKQIPPIGVIAVQVGGLSGRRGVQEGMDCRAPYRWEGSVGGQGHRREGAVRREGKGGTEEGVIRLSVCGGVVSIGNNSFIWVSVWSSHRGRQSNPD